MAFEFAPKYIKIKEDIKSKIASGHFKPGELCMSESQIKESYAVSDTTAKKAIGELVHDGYLFRVHGKGTFVSESPGNSSAKNILVLIPDIRSYMYPPIVRGIEDILQKNNYMPVLCNSDSLAEKEKLYLRMLLNDDVAGMIIVPKVFPIQSRDILEAARNKGFVIINRRIEEWHGDSVLSDDFNGALTAVRHLLKTGCRRILQLLLPQAHSDAAIARTKGYAKALEEYGVDNDPELSVEITGGAEKTFDAMKKILDKKIPFDAVFAQSDQMALLAMKALSEAGLKIPDDVSVIGYSDSDMARFATPALTTVRQPFYEIGRKAADLLIAQLKENKKPVEGLALLPTEFIIRESTRTFR
jgi:GntR family transcriptional regulator of arabinose operon